MCVTLALNYFRLEHMTVMSMPSVSIKMKDGIASASQDLQATEKRAKVYMSKSD